MLQVYRDVSALFYQKFHTVDLGLQLQVQEQEQICVVGI